MSNPGRRLILINLAALLLSLMLIITNGAQATAAEKPVFVWWGSPKTLTNVTIASAVPAADIKYWHDRGGLAAGFVGLGPPKLEGYVQSGQGELLRQKLGERVAQGYPAIALEIERPTDATDAAVLRAFKEAHPGIIIAAWILNSRDIHPYRLLKDGVDIFIYEVYFDYDHPDSEYYRFVGEAKRGSILEKSIFALSVVGVPGVETERELRLIRGIAPEMPGVAFFQYRGTAEDGAADSLAKKYFIDPLLEIRPGDFTVSRRNAGAGDVVELRVKVSNIGYEAAKAYVNVFEESRNKTKRRIAMIGGSIVKGQSQTTIVYSWRPAPGKHRLTVKLAEGKYQTLSRLREARTTINVKRPFRLPFWSGLKRLFDGKIDK